MVKEKSTRCYDADGFRRRAACVCVRQTSSSSAENGSSSSSESSAASSAAPQLEVLLVSSSRSQERWVIPGGGIEPNENPCQAAEREVEEEAGVRGRVQRFLGVFENPESRNRTTVYLFLVTEELESWDDVKIGRLRRWFSVEEARQNLTLHKPRQRRYLDYLDIVLANMASSSNVGDGDSSQAIR